MQKTKTIIGQNIFICGGSCSGKTASVHHLLKSVSSYHLDSDTQLLKVIKADTKEAMRKGFDLLVKGTHEATLSYPLIMEHWLPPRYERELRLLLTGDRSFFVWLYCSDKNELEKRLSQRNAINDTRAIDLIEESLSPPKGLEYDYVLDTVNKKPKEVARLILTKANKFWSK